MIIPFSALQLALVLVCMPVLVHADQTLTRKGLE
ncbi:hypothetical protein SAMN05216316_0259 [Nitrosovibrio sp. Nv6]|nr:hypothetical protein SAMN05216316_0259 [Nitrosovibrio sp. Nv6]